MRRRVVHVRREPHHVLNARPFDLAQQPGNFNLAAQRHAVVAIGNGFPFVAALPILSVRHMQADGHIGRNHFPH